MNHTELAEIRNLIKPGAKYLYINKLVTAYVTNSESSPFVQSFEILDFENLSEEEQDLYCKMLKKTLSGKLGKGLMEYEFIRDENGESRFQKMLYDLRESRLEDEDMVRRFVDQFAQCAGYVGGYYLTIASCEYSVPRKDKNGEIHSEERSQFHRFLLATVNEISLTQIGLYYNKDENSVEKKENEDLQVLPAAMDGFMYPTFTDHSSDVSHVLYYTKNPKKPNDMIIENILGAKTAMTHDVEKEAFRKFMSQVARDELSLDLISHVQGSIRDFVNESSEENELETISRTQMKNLLAQSGLSDGKLNQFNAAYDDAIGQDELKAVNVLDANRMDIKVSDVSITVKGDAFYKVKTKMIDGRQYVCIEVDDLIQVNGMEVTK